MVTIKDISEKCGVSRTTVSKMLNGHKDINESTGEYVRNVAREMGYLPNAATRSLKTRRTNNLGILFIDKTRSGLTHEYFSAVLESFKVEAERLGYDITFINRNISSASMSYYEHYKYQGCDGVAIASVDLSDEMVVGLMKSETPMITIDHVFSGRTAILSDNVQGIRDLVEYVYQCGRRRVAYIRDEDTSVTQKRLTNFYRTYVELSIEMPNEYVKDALYHDPKSSGLATREPLKLSERSTCILYPDDFSFIDGVNEIERRGLHIPEDISVAGYDGIYLSQVLRPRITTLRQDIGVLGCEAAVCLVEAIERPKLVIPQQVMVAGHLIPGSSARKM